jgi:hypothetical protein
LKSILKIGWLQRVLYAIGLVVVVFVSFKDGVNMLNQHSSLGIKYWYFFIIPSSILLYQIIFNNKYGWYTVLFLYGFYFIWTLISIFRGIKDKSGYFVGNDYIVLVMVVMILSLLVYLIYLIKPIKNKPEDGLP